MNEKVVTRFAPSPTGFMHVGGVRTALYAWAFVRKHGGRFILRIEDTDKAREVEGSIPHIIESLKWLGIDWDEGVDIGGPHAPYIQSERLASYKKYGQMLVDKGLAYADPYSPEELEIFRKKAEEEKRPFLYRDYRPENPPVWDGTKPLRLKTPEIKSYEWHDMVRGDLKAGPDALDDFILIKSDGYPTYNFAHIIDDLEMGVTHVFRADEFIASMPKYLSLYDALEITPPKFVTLPPILGAAGTKKLSKRDGAKDILDYQQEGYLPETMINFLAFLGWNPGGEQEIMTPEEVVNEFSIERIHRAGAMWSDEKLLWMNKEHMKKRSHEAHMVEIKKYMGEYPDALLEKLLPSIVDRIATYGELASIEKEEFRFLIQRPEVLPGMVVWKNGTKEEAKTHLEALKPVIEHADLSSSESVKQALMPYAEEKGKGNVLWPLRTALSGQEKSMDPFTIVYLLGKEETCARIEAVCHTLGQ